MIRQAATSNINTGSKGGTDETEIGGTEDEEAGDKGTEEGDKRMRASRRTNNNIDDDEEEDKQTITIADITRFITEMEGGLRTRITTTDESIIMQRIVDAIIRAPESRITNYFAEMPKAQRIRMFRRLAKFVHPDKNAHQFANQAF